MKKSTSKTLTPNSPPVVVAIPSTSEEKMRAITALSEAVSQLAKALNSTNVLVTVQDCHIHTTGRAPGISIE